MVFQSICGYLDGKGSPHILLVSWSENGYLSLRQNTHFFNSSFWDGSLWCYIRLISYLFSKRLMVNCLHIYHVDVLLLVLLCKGKEQASVSWLTHIRAGCLGEITDLMYILSTPGIFQRQQPAPWTFIFSRMMTEHCRILSHQRKLMMFIHIYFWEMASGLGRFRKLFNTNSKNAKWFLVNLC